MLRLKGRMIRWIGFGLLLAAVLASYSVVSAGSAQKVDDAVFHDAMRKLWEDHITWTRLYIISAAEDLPDQGATAQRLVQNQADIAQAIQPFYGEAAARQLEALLKDHILIAAAIIDAAKAGDTAGVESSLAQWHQNAHDIARFLSTANPKQWAFEELHMMMTGHLDLTLKEATARLSRNYAADIAAYDELHFQILEMADMLSEGIIKQFPAKFN